MVTVVPMTWDPATCVHAMISTGRRMKMAAGVSWRHADADPMVEVRWCSDCNNFLPLPDPDPEVTPAVALEIRAAFISAYSKDHEGALDEVTTPECMGYVEGTNDVDVYISYYTDAEWAGWLAAQIDN